MSEVPLPDPLSDPESVQTVTVNSGRAAAAEHPTVWGHFRDLKPLGGGGFGTVYRAWDTQLHREVALKLLAPHGDAEADQDAAILEARMMARVRHPNIVPVYGVATVQERIGFWSELIEGPSLGALVKTGGPMDARQAAGMVIELCKAVAAMHAAGILHRDIKAENALRDSTGRVLLTDFGLSRDPGSRFFGGTLEYMAPELLQSLGASPASDVYALGVLLYFLVSGRFPASGSLDKMRHAMTSGALRPLSEARPGLPKAYLAIVIRATAIQPEARFATAEGMLMALQAFVAEERPIAARRWLLPAGIALVVLAVSGAAVAWFLMHRSNDAYVFERRGQELLARRDKPGNAAAAVKLFGQAVAADPKFALARTELADSLWAQYRQTKDPELKIRAVAEADKALAFDSESAQGFVVEGRIHAATGKRDLALGDLNRALKLDPRNADAYRELAQLYNADGRDADADAAYQKAIDLDPNNWWNFNARGVWFISKGRLDEAAAEYQKALALTPDNTWALNNLAAVRLSQRRLAEARHLLERSVKLAPEDPNAHEMLGVLQMQLGNYDAAEAEYTKTTKVRPGDYASWASLASATEYGTGGIAKAKPVYRKAIELAETALKENPSDARLASRLGSYLAVAGDRDRAVTLVRQALALAPHDNEVLVFAGNAYEILGQREKAIPLIMEALSRGYPADLVKRNPELVQLSSDPRFRWPEAPAVKP